ncbi:MAG: hypothetical protein QM438_04450 [Euryarchaeota archaeon]|nr:hypothetical protein [Euryarchaeota archaeon]
MSELKKCYEALDALAGNERIQKSAYDKELSPREARAVRIAKATKTAAGRVLARKILELQRAEATQLAYAVPLAKAMGLDSGRGKPATLRKSSDDQLLKELERRGYDVRRA